MSKHLKTIIQARIAELTEKLTKIEAYKIDLETEIKELKVKLEELRLIVNRGGKRERV